MGYKICKLLTYNLIWLTNDIIDNNYKLLLLLWYVYEAGDGLDHSSVNSTLWICRCARQKKTKTLERRITSDLCPAHCHRQGRAYVSYAFMWIGSLLWKLGSKDCFADMFLCSSLTLDWTEQHWSRDSVACRGRSQQLPAPMYLYYIVLTKFLCLTTLLLRASENPCWCLYLTSVQMHLFENEMKPWHIWINDELCFLWRLEY